MMPKTNSKHTLCTKGFQLNIPQGRPFSKEIEAQLSRAVTCYIMEYFPVIKNCRYASTKPPVQSPRFL